MKLYQLENNLKYWLSLFLVVMSIGVTIGLIYVRTTTNISAEGTVHRYAGSEVKDEFDIPEHYPKPVSDMLMTTHNHIITFAMIFGLIGMLFYFNSIIDGTWKFILMAEPLISTLVTFGSIWGIRFIAPQFSYITIVSGVLMYVTYYVMVAVMLYELLFFSAEK
ncbi:MAG: hypothetical protein H8E72_08635 [Candidatus Marinimicrobia bacterium]|nr:hypothetical protein [Candidatus Neomarinimicrobiota bacterium]